MTLSIERVQEDHQDVRVTTHLVEGRGRTIEVRVEHQSPRSPDGLREYTKFSLDLYVVEGENGLEVQVIDKARQNMVSGILRYPFDQRAATLATINLLPDTRTFT